MFVLSTLCVYKERDYSKLGSNTALYSHLSDVSVDRSSVCPSESNRLPKMEKILTFFSGLLLLDTMVITQCHNTPIFHTQCGKLHNKIEKILNVIK